MTLNDLLVESFDLKDYNLKKVNKKQIIEIFENYEFSDKKNENIAFEWLHKHDRIFGWIYKNYLVFYTHYREYMEWHFLNMDHLDTDKVLNDTSINSHEILNVVFNIIYNKMILRGKSYSFLIGTPDENRYKLYKHILEKVIKKYNIKYELSNYHSGIELNPILSEGSFYYKKQ